MPTLTVYNAAAHLSWGDIAIDSLQSPKMLKIHLKRSKTDQYGNGVDIFVGRTDGPLCPVAGVLALEDQRRVSFSSSKMANL